MVETLLWKRLLFLTKFAKEVVIIHRREEFRASKIMIDRAISNPKISVSWNSTINEIIGNKETGVYWSEDSRFCNR